MTNAVIGLRALGFSPGVDFEARDDGDERGVYVERWLSDRPQPDDAAIAEAAAMPVALKDAVPASVSNFQARSVMRQTPMPDGRSLFTTVDEALREAVDATRTLAEFDPARVEADISWQAWEQANDYFRDGAMVMMLASRFKLDAARTDALFRAASQVRV